MVTNLAFWSVVALTLRTCAIVLFVLVAKQQVDEIKRKSVVSLIRLKWLLLSCVAVLIISNLPIMVLHVGRIYDADLPVWVTSVSTVTNAGAVLIAAILLLLIYRYKD